MCTCMAVYGTQGSVYYSTTTLYWSFHGSLVSPAGKKWNFVSILPTVMITLGVLWCAQPNYGVEEEGGNCVIFLGSGEGEGNCQKSSFW